MRHAQMVLVGKGYLEDLGVDGSYRSVGWNGVDWIHLNEVREKSDYQSVSQSVRQSASQLVSQSVSPSVSQSACHSVSL